MVTIYASDISKFTLDDWEDFFTTHDSTPDFVWEDFRRKESVKMTFPDVDWMCDWAGVSFMFDKGDRGSKFKWSDKLQRLLDDLESLRDVKEMLYQKVARLTDEEFSGTMDYVSDIFGREYDSACESALLDMVKELREAE